jgi:4-amino-4-deoxy-L-arabinose transferase-like glycosyltransferase
MSLTACLFMWAILLALKMREEPPRIKPWLLFGTLWGLIALSNSSLITVLPFSALWIAWPRLRQPATLRNLVLAAICCVTVISPWIIRNALVFHAFVPLRSNFGAELYESARLDNEGYPTMATLPHSQAAPEFQRYVDLGELAYCREQGALARQIIRAHPGAIVNHMLRRVYFFWASVPHPTDETFKGLLNETGRELNFAFLSLSGLLGLALALRNRAPGAWLFFWAFAIYPLTYYAITVQARFRHPLEPLICILAVYLFRSATPKQTETTGGNKHG